MRSVSHALKLVIGGAGLAALLLGAVAPAGAAPSESGVKLDGAVATPGKAATELPAGLSASEGPRVCFRGHVQNIGWQQWNCDDDVDGRADAGVTGQGLRLEAIQVVGYETGGLTCAQAHVENIGWQGEEPRCAEDGVTVEVGTVGRSLRIESLLFGSTVVSTCAEGHVQNYGWQGEICQPVGYASIVGTEGESLRLEAVKARINKQP